MKVGIYESDLWTLPQYNKVYKEVLDYNNIPWESLTLDTFDFWEKVSNLDYFLFRFVNVDEHLQIAKTILPIIEKELRIQIFPNQKTCWHFDDKIKQYYLAKLNDIPFIECFIFWDKRKALEWANAAEYPTVFKLKGGAGSSNVLMLKDKEHAYRLIKKIFGRGIKHNKIPGFSTTKFHDLKSILRSWGYPIYAILKKKEYRLFWNKHKNYALFQKFLPNNEFDTRVTVIGSYAYAFRRFVRKNDFRASGSGLIDYDVNQIDIRCIKIAFETSRKMGFQSMAYDFLFNEKQEPEICEMSYTYQDEALYGCMGIWDDKLNWISGHFWPGYLQLKSLLNKNDLKQPQISF